MERHVTLPLRYPQKKRRSGFDKQRLQHGGGLGLSYVLQQVRDLGGGLEVDTGPDRGTMLKIELPKDAGRS